jgi:hypothetical protein
MRLSFQKRLVRFLFYPVSLMGVIMLLNWDFRYEMIQDLCHRRSQCFSHCTSDNFPSLSCRETTVNIRYNGTEYSRFFEFPNPNKRHATRPDGVQARDFDAYETCQSYTNWNPNNE